MDDEYSALMAELGEAPTGGSSGAMSTSQDTSGAAAGRGGMRGGHSRGGHRGGFQNPRELFGPPKGEDENPAQQTMAGYYGKNAYFLKTPPLRIWK